jgi:ribonuclease HII
MEKRYSNKKWILASTLANEIKELLKKNNGIEDIEIKNKNELWRIKLFDATFTYYKTGTLFCTATNNDIVRKRQQQIDEIADNRFVPATKTYLIGLDETGKGEVLGPMILAGVFFPQKIFSSMEEAIGTADSKNKRTVQYWIELEKRLFSLKESGFSFLLDKIPPEHTDRFNTNKILDIVYQRIISILFRKADISKVRVTIDDYGIGDNLLRYLANLNNTGAEIIVAPKADEQYLETKVASLIAKIQHEKLMENIRNCTEYQIKKFPLGSGNAGDEKTLKWLKAWYQTGKPWPWFVKKSFKTVREIEGKLEAGEKENPPFRENLLCDDFMSEEIAENFSIKNLSVVCPAYGTVRKTSLVLIDENQTIGRCAYCKTPIEDLNHTLRYYCGYILPDSNVILKGLLSKDLSHSRFFQGFTILIHPLVKRECDNQEGKEELHRLMKCAENGIVELRDLEAEAEIKASIVLDKAEQFTEAAIKFNAIIVSDDIKIILSAQNNDIFSIYL